MLYSQEMKAVMVGVVVCVGVVRIFKSKTICGYFYVH